MQPNIWSTFYSRIWSAITKLNEIAKDPETALDELAIKPLQENVLRKQTKYDTQMNVLFVCSRNRWRSRTAETIFKDDQSHEFRSAGTENDARIKVNEKLINWAEVIFVMEKRHKQRLQDKFDQLLENKEIIILDIQDNYQYMDKELIEALKTSVAPYL